MLFLWKGGIRLIDEDVSRRTIAVSIKATKLTGRVLAQACLAVGRKIKKTYRARQTPHGKQTVRQLTASYFVAVWKMLRKKGCVPSALTQNVKDLLASREIEAILDNTDFMILLSQAQSDRAILAKQLGISEHQLSYITHSNSGEGLLFYGDVTIPFVDRFPRGEIYNLLTTRPEDLKNEAKTE